METPLPSAFRLVLALFTVLTVARISDLIPGLQGIPLGKLLGVVMIGMAFTSLPRDRVAAAFRSTPVRAMLVVAVLALLSVPTSVWRSESVSFIQRALLPVMVFFFVGSIGFADRRATRLAIWLMLLSVAAGAIRMFVAPDLDREGRARFGSLDANDTAALFVVAVPFALMLASEKGAPRRLLYALPLLFIAALVKTGSRGGLVGLVAIAVCLTLFATPRRRLTYVVGIVAGAFTFGLTADGALKERFATIFAVEDDYNLSDRDGRIDVWKRGIGYMITHPILGVGIGGFETADGTLSGKRNEGYGIRYTAAHNSFVQVGAELGVGGLLAFSTAVGAAGLGCWRTRRRALAMRHAAPALADDEAALAGTALVSLIGLVTTAFFLSFAYHPITIFAIAMCTGVAAGARLPGTTADADGYARSDEPPAASPRGGRRAMAAGGWRSSGSRRFARG